MESRNALIDSTRGICVLSVVFFHFNLNSFFAEFGLYGVTIFFVISGFCMDYSLRSSVSFFDFIRKRFIRLLPTLIVCGFITSVVKVIYKLEGIPESFNNFYKTIIFLPNFNLLKKVITLFIPSYQEYKFVDGSYWSLIVEFKFYYLLGLIYFFFSKEKLLSILLFFTILILTCFYFLYKNSLNVPGILYDFVEYLPFFILGICFNNMSKFRDWIFILVVISVLLGAFNANISPYSQPYSLIQFFIVLLAIPWFHIIRYKLVKTNILISMFAFLGKISYPLYLLHQVIGINLIQQLTTSFSKIVSISLTLLLLILSSYIIHVLVEIKFGNYLKKKLC
jgi:peptidoglycan/LPS O-acetylase OafA/YrhL